MPLGSKRDSPRWAGVDHPPGCNQSDAWLGEHCRLFRSSRGGIGVIALREHPALLQRSGRFALALLPTPTLHILAESKHILLKYRRNSANSAGKSRYLFKSLTIASSELSNAVATPYEGSAGGRIILTFVCHRNWLGTYGSTATISI